VRQHRFEVDFFAQYWQQKGQRTRPLEYRAEIFLPDTVKGMRTKNPTVRRNTDDRGTHV
jgi:hypothetical protein